MVPSSMSFSPAHHALLYAWIARAVVLHCGEREGAEIMRESTRQYGKQRGHRMALRAAADGRAPDFVSYLAYPEWRAPAHSSRSSILETNPDLHRQVHSCPWFDAWRESGLLPWGRLYCLDIDQALVRGFNPTLVLEVSRTLSNGADVCDFRFREAGLDTDRMDELRRLQADLGERAIMSWEYHVGHLHATAGAVIVGALGDVGRGLVEDALVEFGGHFGPDAAAVVRSYAGTDFDSLSEEGDSGS